MVSADQTKLETEIETRPREPLERQYGKRLGDGRLLERSTPFEHPNRERVVAVIPAYNEERFIGSIVLQTLPYAATVIVVDDGSSDGTARVAECAGAVVVQHTHNQGKGAALNTGLQATRVFPSRVVVLLDADGQHNAADLSSVVEPIMQGEADLVIGSRYLDKASEVPRARIWGHKAFNLITWLSSGTTSSDSQSGYRALSPRAIAKTHFSSKGFSVESEMQFIAHEYDLRLVEVPITIRYPDEPKRNVIAHGLYVLNGLLRLIGQYRPLLFFGVPGMVLLLLGLFWGAMVVGIHSNTGQLAVGYAMLSVLLTILGSLGLVTGIILHSVRGLMIETLEPRIKKE